MASADFRARLGRLTAHPVTFLLAINLACAALGLAQFAYALSVLYPADFAVIGVLAAVGGVIVGLLDVKLADLATKLFFATPKEDGRRRSQLLSAGLLLHLVAGLVVAALVLVAASLMAGRLLNRGVEGWWVAATAARMASAYPVTALTTFLRLVGAFNASGWLRLATQIFATAAMFSALSIEPSLGGYFAATAATAAMSVVLAVIVASPRIATALGAGLLQSVPLGVLREYLASSSFLAGGSLAGLAKLLSRSGDTILVAALTNDATTGLYRVARQAYDTLAGLTDAVHQFYTPTIVDCIGRGLADEFRKHRRRLILIGTAAASGALLVSWMILRPLAAARVPHYAPALPAFEIFAGLLIVTLGVHGWLWPSLVATGRVGRFGLLGALGASAQLVALVALAYLGRLDATTAATTAWIMALINYGPLLGLRHGPGMPPPRQQ